MQVLDPENTQVPVVREKGAPVAIASSRAAQEVQAAMLVAKHYPRDVNAAYARILQGCRRKALAEQSAYAYPRGGTKVTGPSIRLAEHLAQNWGNFESGVIELERKDGESVAMAYAWDLETNARDVKVFTVEHVRERSETKGGNVALTDPRDVYELLANQGARRKRACILALIPGDIVDAAEAECDKTLKGDNTEPLIDRVRKMAAVFMEIGVTTELMEKRLGHVLDATNENELVGLRKIYVSLRDGMSKREDWFAPEPSEQPTGKQNFGFKKVAEEKPKEKAKEPVKEQQKDVSKEPAKESPKVPDAARMDAREATDDAALAAEAKGREEAEAAQHRTEQQVGTSQTSFSPSTSTASQQAEPERDLVKEVTRLGKEKGVNMFDLSGFATRQYGHRLIDCSTLELQGILKKLQGHTKGEQFK